MCPPTYDFTCLECDQDFEIVESIKDYSGKAECPTCKNVSNSRVYDKCAFYNIGAAVESPEYNPALGQVVKNSSHRKQIAKEKGLIEVGNEPTEKIHKKYESDRIERRKKSWENI